MIGVLSYKNHDAFHEESVDNLFSRRGEIISTLKRVSPGLQAPSKKLNWNGEETEWQPCPSKSPVSLLLGGKVFENVLLNYPYSLSYNFDDSFVWNPRYVSCGVQEENFFDTTRCWDVEDNSYQLVKPLEFRPVEQIYWKSFEREELEDQVFKTYELLNAHDNSVSKHLSNYLHEFLHLYAVSDDEAFLYQAANVVFFYVEFTYTTIKNISAQIRSLLCNYFLCIKRDLRKLFRSIVRFLFKNMDADDDHTKILLVPVSKQNFLIKSLGPNGYIIHHNLFKNNC